MASTSFKDSSSLSLTTKCYNRRDASGFWNQCKTWYIYVLHLASCIGFTIALFTLIDGRNFRVGSTPRRGWNFYQADITGIVSTSLVLIRTIAGLGSTLLVWRLVTILLAKGQITLAGLCQIVGNRNPLHLHRDPSRRMLWSSFTVLVVALLWPSPFAPPLANSSLTWHPRKQEIWNTEIPYEVNSVETNKKFFDNLQYEHLKWAVTLRAVATGILEPSYAFFGNDTSLRRYLSLDPAVPEGGVGTMHMPYFNVTDIRWLDSPAAQYDEKPVLGEITNASTLHNPVAQFGAGTIGFWMPERWSVQDTLKYTLSVYEGKRNISIMVGSLWDDQKLRNGSFPTQQTPCQTYYPELGTVPDVRQYRTEITVGEVWRRTDCHMLAEVSMKAGRYLHRPAWTHLLGFSTGVHIVTPTTEQWQGDLEPDWAIGPTLDMMTDVMRQILQLNATQRFQYERIDTYVRGTLKLAYDATWSALPLIIDDSRETFRIVPYESVIRAEINRLRVYIWLAMNLTLELAAIIVAIVHFMTAPRTKMTRDPALTALMMDLNEVKHFNRDGLCNAAALMSGDKKLGRMRWESEGGGNDIEIGADQEVCSSKVVFDDGLVQREIAGTMPLLRPT